MCKVQYAYQGVSFIKVAIYMEIYEETKGLVVEVNNTWTKKKSHKQHSKTYHV